MSVLTSNRKENILSSAIGEFHSTNGQLSASANNSDLGFYNLRYPAQPHPMIAYCILNEDEK